MSAEATEEAKVQDAQTQRVVAAPATSAAAVAAASDAVRIHICTTGGQTSVHQPAVFTTTRATPVHHSVVGSTGQRLVNVVPQAASSSVLVVAKVPTPGLCATGQPLHLTRPASAPAVSAKTPAPGRTVVVAVPKATVPQPLAPRPQQTSSTQLPANFQIPPGEE